MLVAKIPYYILVTLLHFFDADDRFVLIPSFFKRIVSAIDITIHDVQFYGMKLAGIILISIGFLLVMFPNNWPEYIFRLLR